MKPMVSIIVPVYNAAPYLNQCVDSLTNQTLKEIEIILINDGSTDDSLAVCVALSATDDRIRMIDKPNGGVSEARNDGLRAATGEHVGFVDDIYFLFGYRRRILDFFADFAYFVHAVIGSGQRLAAKHYRTSAPGTLARIA